MTCRRNRKPLRREGGEPGEGEAEVVAGAGEGVAVVGGAWAEAAEAWAAAAGAWAEAAGAWAPAPAGDKAGARKEGGAAPPVRGRHGVRNEDRHCQRKRGHR